MAAADPQFIRKEDVTKEVLDKERDIQRGRALQEGKPEKMMDKIVEGRMNGWFKERGLLDQAYVRDEKQTVDKLLGSAEVVEFAQVVIGS